MKIEELRMLQALPLDIKIAKTELRIMEFVTRMGLENVYVSFSGGKDSTVLLDICRRLYPEIKAVFINTGLEYPELVDHVKTYNNIEIIRPKLTFKQVLEKYGYPIISKEQSRYLHDIKHSTEKMRNLRLSKNTRFRLSDKYKYLIDAPFEVSNRCCDVMKKAPAHNYNKATGRSPIIGTMAEESQQRTRIYLEYGCNAFDKKDPSSTPLGFWTEQDILHYIKVRELQIPSVYGEVIEENGIYKTTGVHRTGCIFCMYGIQFEKNENRFQKLKKTHPQLHNYCMSKLGFKEVCEFMNIKTE